MKFACKRYFSSISSENHSSSSFFTKSAFKCTSEVNKAHQNQLREENSGELRNGALQIWRGVICFSRDFTFRINILNPISTLHKHSFFIITNVLSVSRDLSHPFLTFYFNPNLHHFINNTCNLIQFSSMTIDTKFMKLTGVFLNYLRFVNYNVSC